MVCLQTGRPPGIPALGPFTRKLADRPNYGGREGPQSHILRPHHMPGSVTVESIIQFHIRACNAEALRATGTPYDGYITSLTDSHQ